MTPITKAQRLAIKRVYDRQPLYLFLDELGSEPKYRSHEPITYREFRKRVVSSYDCLMVKWLGMWLGIESDGYTHS